MDRAVASKVSTQSGCSSLYLSSAAQVTVAYPGYIRLWLTYDGASNGSANGV